MPDQEQTGSLFGVVKDDQGGGLAGVTVTLFLGGSVAQVNVTDNEGIIRFPDLAPGSYEVKAELEGYSPSEYPNVVVNALRTTQIEVTLYWP